MIRIFNHDVSKMAFVLLMLELRMLLASTGAASALWLAEGAGRRRADKLYGWSLTFAPVIIFSMSAQGRCQHSARAGIRIMPSFADTAQVVVFGKGSR